METSYIGNQPPNGGGDDIAMFTPSGSTSIPNGTGFTKISLNTLTFENGSHGLTVNGSNQIVIPAGVSMIRVSGVVTFAANATSYRGAVVQKNGASQYQTNNAQNGNSSIATCVTIATGLISVTSGDLITLCARQGSGSSLNVSGNSSATNITQLTVEVLRS